MTITCRVTGDHWDGTAWRRVEHVVRVRDDSSEEDKGAALYLGIRTLVRTHPGTRNVATGEWTDAYHKTRKTKTEEDQDHDQ